MTRPHDFLGQCAKKDAMYYKHDITFSTHSIQCLKIVPFELVIFITLVTSPERRVVAFLRLLHQSLLLEGVGEVAVGVREVGLQLYGAAVRVDGQVDQPEILRCVCCLCGRGSRRRINNLDGKANIGELVESSTENAEGERKQSEAEGFFCKKISFKSFHLPLFVVDAGQVPVDHGVVGAEVEGAKVRGHGPDVGDKKKRLAESLHQGQRHCR